MKKDRNDGSPLPRGLSQKMLLRMRLTTLLLCCLFVQSFATASAQSITLKMRNASLEEVIWELKEKTKLTFLYTDEDVASVKGIDLDVKDLDVDAVLEYNLRHRLFIRADCYFRTSTTGWSAVPYTQASAYRVPAFVDVGLRISYAVNTRLMVFVEGNNLTNSKIQYFLNYVEPGINFGAGVCFKL